MKKHPDQDALSELRRRAEAKLTGDEPALGSASPEEMSTLIHELHTHQIELELQNEELRRAQAELVESRDQYTSLYDFAPVGYATVNGKGIIQQANLRLTEMLGVPRGQLVGRPLSAFVCCFSSSLPIGRSGSGPGMAAIGLAVFTRFRPAGSRRSGRFVTQKTGTNSSTMLLLIVSLNRIMTSV